MLSTPDGALPLTVITGLDAAAKARVAAALLGRGEHGWALLDNDGGAALAAATASGVAAAASSGCACCTGQVMLHAALVELLRRQRPRQLLLVAAAAAEPAALRRALAQGCAMRAWQVARNLCIWDDNRFAAAGADARALWQEQREAADAVIRCSAATTAAELVDQLATVADSAGRISPSKASSRRIDS